MATAGPRSGGTFVNDASIGAAGVVWTNPSNAASSNDVRASNSSWGGVGGEDSNALKCTNFGFTIPAGATINGITVASERNAATASNINDNMVRLVKADTYAGDNKASATFWPTTDTVASYGGAADLWGATWTADDINNAGFGVGISANDSAGGGVTARIDHVTITVTYTEAVAASGSNAAKLMLLGLL